MKRERKESNLWLPPPVLRELIRVAQERGSTLTDLADEQVRRIESDGQYAYYLLPFVNEIIKRRLVEEAVTGGVAAIVSQHALRFVPNQRF